MVKVKSAEAIDKKYKDAIARVPAAYQEGINNANDWKGAAVAGQKNYVEQMSKAEVLARRERGLAPLTNESWKGKAIELGTKRIADGMRANADKRRTNYEPVRAALESLTLPPKSTDPYANIQNRVIPTVRQMRKAVGKE